MAAKKTGVKTVVYLQEGEKLITIKPEAMYKLGYPLEEIIYGHTVIDAVGVTWDEIEQKWIC